MNIITQPSSSGHFVVHGSHVSEIRLVAIAETQNELGLYEESFVIEYIVFGKQRRYVHLGVDDEGNETRTDSWEFQNTANAIMDSLIERLWR
jgi:hypothetical protein